MTEELAAKILAGSAVVVRSSKVQRKKGGRYSYIAIYVPLEAAGSLRLEPGTYYVLEKSPKGILLRKIDASEVRMPCIPLRA